VPGIIEEITNVFVGWEAVDLTLEAERQAVGECLRSLVLVWASRR
jgi:hypothetical protein